jgi:hypothetical protein
LFHNRSQQALLILKKWKEQNESEWMPVWEIHRRMPCRVRDLRDVLDALTSQRLITYYGISSAAKSEEFYRLDCEPTEIRAHAAAEPKPSWTRRIHSEPLRQAQEIR